MYKFKTKFFFIFLTLFLIISSANSAEKVELLTQDWSFKGITGKFDRASLQRGYQVYSEVCASCHSMRLLSYRNLGEEGGPEFSVDQVKAIAANFEVTDGPNADGDMFTRPGALKICITLSKYSSSYSCKWRRLSTRHVCTCEIKKRWSRLYILSFNGI